MKSKFEWSGKRIWLTGASSGIGTEIAKQLLQYDCQLILSGRNLSALQALSHFSEYSKPLLLPFDLTHKTEHVAAIEKIKKHYGGLDIVILNAGACDFYDPKNFSSKVFENLNSINFLSVAYSIEASLPLLRESSSAMIVATSSIASGDGLPFGMGAYCASKAALDVMLKSLAIDLYPENIHVLLISPGFVDTPLSKKNPFLMPVLITPQRAARNILYAIEKKRYISYFPKRLGLLFRYVSRMPRAWYVPLMSKMGHYLTKNTHL